MHDDDAGVHYAFCQVCDPPRRVLVQDILLHLSAVHGIKEEPERWPDGEWVIVDDALEPADFEEEADA